MVEKDSICVLLYLDPLLQLGWWRRGSVVECQPFKNARRIVCRGVAVLFLEFAVCFNQVQNRRDLLLIA